MTTTFAYCFQAGLSARKQLFGAVERVANKFDYPTSASLDVVSSRENDFHVLDGFKALTSSHDRHVLLVSNGQERFELQDMVPVHSSLAPDDVRCQFFDFLRETHRSLCKLQEQFDEDIRSYKIVFAEYWRTETMVRYLSLRLPSVIDLLRSSHSWQQAHYNVSRAIVGLREDFPLLISVSLRSPSGTNACTAERD